MRIAFFGGTFDPPHRGHLAIARAAADRLQLDRVLFAPVGNQPLKQNSSIASFEDRVTMVRLAIANEAHFELSAIDAPRSDHRPNYTIDTICLLRKSLNPDDQLFCLVGADSFLNLHQWHRAGELLVACDFIIAGRPGFDFSNIAEILPPNIYISDPPHQPGLSMLKVTSDIGLSSILYLLPDLNEKISATEVRTTLGDHLTQSDALPRPVADYIRTHHLYQ